MAAWTSEAFCHFELVRINRSHPGFLPNVRSCAYTALLFDEHTMLLISRRFPNGMLQTNLYCLTTYYKGPVRSRQILAFISEPLTQIIALMCTWFCTNLYSGAILSLLCREVVSTRIQPKCRKWLMNKRLLGVYMQSDPLPQLFGNILFLVCYLFAR